MAWFPRTPCLCKGASRTSEYSGAARIEGERDFEKLTVLKAARKPCRDFRVGPDSSVLKRNTDEIALPPDHAAFANGMKFVETQFEIQRQQIEGCGAQFRPRNS